MTERTLTWPRAFLLSIYDRAISEGAIWVTGITADEARSITQSLYRLRRRSDKSNQSFVRPEFHLVTCAQYDVAQSRMAVMFDALPDNLQLPTLEAVESSERILLTQPPAIPSLAVPELTGESIEMQDEDIDDLVARLTRQATGGGDD